MTEPTPQPQFDDLAQQHGADELGMWIFLATETLLFGALFLGYIAYRLAYPAAFAAGGRQTDMVLGTLNTGVLLTSSLTMALAVGVARAGSRRWAGGLLALTGVLGLAFLSIKFSEYGMDYRHGLAPGLRFVYSGAGSPQVALFFVFYFVMTALHALHLSIGVVLVAGLAVLSWRGHLAGPRSMPITLGGLYWHFVDVVWVFLYPSFYLLGRH